MLIQACLNGSRRPGDHPALPLTAAELAADARQAVDAGAGELHVHPRDGSGAETLEAAFCDEALLAIRRACPGVPVGLSTAAWIEPDPSRRNQMVASWTERPNFVSVNFSETGAAGLCRLLLQLGVGIEAGLWTAADAELLLDSGLARHLVRALVEPQDVDPEAAEETADRITTVLDRGDVTPRIYHGNGIATWRVIDYGLDGRWDVRAGLEDTLLTPDGSRAEGNALLVLEVVGMARKRGRLPPT